MPHPLYTLLAAAFVSAAMSAGDRSRAIRTFTACIASVVVGGWLMHFIQ